MSELLCDPRQELITQAHCWTAELQQRRDEDFHIQRTRPFHLMQPKLFLDGDQWCALYGENIQEGVCGFGKSPHRASLDFDVAYYAEKEVRG